MFFRRTATFLFLYEISREPLNGFAPSSHGRRTLSLARTSLKVKVNFGGMRAVYVWKNIFALAIMNEKSLSTRIKFGSENRYIHLGLLLILILY